MHRYLTFTSSPLPCIAHIFSLPSVQRLSAFLSARIFFPLFFSLSSIYLLFRILLLLLIFGAWRARVIGLACLLS